MRAVEGIISNALGDMMHFIVNGMLPWAWENKFWIIALIPVLAIIAIAKWMWD